MYSIKNSYANCLECELLEAPSCILETNCEDDLSKVDIVVIAENPGKDEVKLETPLIGKAGKMFRKYFEKYNLHKCNYLLTNTVLCQTLNSDDTTGNPESNVSERCKVNCMSIIRICQPKLIVLMGGTPMSAFGIADKGITALHGKITQWEGIDTMVLVHPSFVNRQIKVWESKFDQEGMRKVAEYMGTIKTSKISLSTTTTNKTGIFRYKIPEKYYTEDYRLVDIQFLNKTQEVLYIFRDKDNNKIFHKENDDYICYQAKPGIKTKKIVPYDDLEQIKIKYGQKRNLDSDITYEGDLRITVKHAMDYYHYNKGDCKRTHNNIMFFDIEVDTGKMRVFPTPTESNFPINLITTIYNGETTCYILNNYTEPIKEIKGVNFKVFDKERPLLMAFLNDLKANQPDFLAGWNAISFDIQYIYNRLPKLAIQQELLSTFGEVYLDVERYVCHLPGLVAIDQDFLYRTFTFTKMENYKLGFIAQHELGVTKVDLPLPFNEMYWKMLNTTIEYNVRDTELLDKLEKKLEHINLMNELRIICNTSFDAVSSFGQTDSIMVSYLKNKGLSSKNADPHIVKEKYPGAFVFDPQPGTYDWLTDFDFASLYPSLMITYNIGVNSFVMKTVDPKIGYDLVYAKNSLPKTIKVIIDPLCDKIEMEITPQQLFDKIERDRLVHTVNGCFFLPHDKEFSVFGEVVDMLMKSRKQYKKQMFDAIESGMRDEEKFFYTRQLVYKVLANTLYGVVANKAFRFFDLSLASAITLSGQEALKTAIIEGDAFMRSLQAGIAYKHPSMLTKREMFTKDDESIDRSNEYIVTGDTDSIFCCFQNFRDIDVKKVLKFCEKIEEFLNDNVMNHLVHTHNVELQYNRLKLKNELVISRGLFLAKKRYCIRVIANEGKDVDKINHMGVEIKRSDFPRETKEFLKELVKMVLTSEKISLNKINEFINKKEKYFLNMVKTGDKKIAKPVSFGKNIEDYKSISQGVKAMLAWNSIMYNIHQKGARGYMYYIKGIDFDKIPDPEERAKIEVNYSKFIGEGNKLEVIAIPDEEPRLPEWFIPNEKETMRFVFKDRHELMLKPIADLHFKKDTEGIMLF